jgi:hypothetical protein
MKQKIEELLEEINKELATLFAEKSVVRDYYNRGFISGQICGLAMFKNKLIAILKEQHDQ